MFCGVEISKKYFQRGKDLQVQTLNFDNTLLYIYEERRDKWSEDVNQRAQSVLNLHAAGACYNQQCSANFRTEKQIPFRFTDLDQGCMKMWRPGDQKRHEAILIVVHHLKDNYKEQIIIITDLVNKMAEYLP